MNRRHFLASSALATTASQAGSDAANATQKVREAGSRVSLREKFFGCIVGAHVGSAFGAPVEGWTYDRIEEKHGTVDRLLPYRDRLAGSTEDGVERQKLMITAIIEKQDRVTAEDVRKIWVRDINPELVGTISEPFEAVLLAMAKSGIPACDLGRYCDYAGLNSMARACHPLGLINAGDPQNAVADVFEVGQLYQTSNSRGLQWAAITGLSIAAATSPKATVDSVIAAVLQGDPRFAKPAGGDRVTREIERGLKITQGCRDFRELRKAFDSVYSGRGIPYAFASANEVVTKAVCVFYMVKGNVKDAMIAAANLGRDTDCLVAISAGISGALTGSSSVPEEWIKQVDHATTVLKYTNTRRTLREHADGLYQAYRARLRRLRAYSDEMESA